MKNLLIALILLIAFTSCESRSAQRSKMNMTEYATIITSVSASEYVTVLKRDFPNCRVFITDTTQKFIVLHADKLYSVSMRANPIKVMDVKPIGEF